ncbi:helix-turn-helix domain-containing protein [Streptomyces sp. NPDC018321]|uniref:helix-turn-helix domain-containing protein n=1 Tax=unclassified Streptomyces TaxID=2593676 RepID=UPI0037954E41
MTSAHTRLVTALRELRTRTGLSLAALAERTAYSKSSWERYLNGKTLPPRQAVRDLCRLAREPEGRALALWEIAESERSGRAAQPAPAPAGPDPQPQPQPQPPTRQPGVRRRLLAVLVAVCAVTVAGVASALLLLPDRERAAPRASAGAAPGPRCHGATCEGQDPMHMFCGGGPDTLSTHRTATGARLELRYSEKCGAGWARMWGTGVGDRLEVTAGGPTRRAEIADAVDAESYVYTVMTEVRPGAVLRACFRPAAAADGERECVEARVGGATATTRPPSRR